ncbi:MAG TPA: signal recognition particle-docking protein FtsY, partial [Planctomycetota bacterium]|nr:signal recognition particle-docking protein FtsY [Planctomycetota bacterium]
KEGLKKTKEKVLGGLRAIIPFGRDLSDDLIEEMEEYLLTADIGPRTVQKIMARVREAYKSKVIRTTDDCYVFLKKILKEMLKSDGASLKRAPSGPTVILVAGVNGSGKTTSIAKLAYRLKAEGGTVMLAAADTFRAAAVEQLATWCDRLGCQIIRQSTGSDPAAVAFDAVEAALARDVTWLVIDTAGRLHTQKNLMAELDKIKRVITRKIPDAPHETILVLDATTGQNAINQANEFGRILNITGLFLTKLDGTAKGGAVIGIRDQVNIPIKFIGVGEKPENIEDFDAEAFVEGLFSLEDE